MKHATVLLILDAARADYLRSMPFLAGLSQEVTTGRFESPPGFAQRTVLFTGRYPDTSGNFSAFVYDPEGSPYRWVRRLGPLRAAIRPRRILFPTRLAVDRVTRWKTGANHTDPAWIPPRYLPFFRPCEDMRPVYEPGALGGKSLFDLCRDHGRSFRYLAHPVSGDDEWIYHTLIKELRESRPYDLYVAQFSVPDQKGHELGPESDELHQVHLRTLDERLASIHAALAGGYDSWDLLVVGDHGMAPVRTKVDVLGRLKGLSARPGRDYVVFVNSTLAVFWYLTETGRREIEAVLPTVEGARAVDEEERRRRRIPTGRRWGDRMLAAAPGVLFWPDYFHVKGSVVRGMHGYLDKSEETQGLALLASSNGHAPARDLGVRPLVDVFPTLCDLLGLPLPPGQEGRSLIQADRITGRIEVAARA